MDIYTSNIPEKIIKDVKDLIREFLWNGKKWEIAKKNIALRKEHGGLELYDIENFIKCKKIRWLLRVHFGNNSTWNTYGKHCLAAYDNVYDIDNFLLKCTTAKGLNVKLPGFYKTCLEAWQSVTSKVKITTKQDILEQNLFGNYHIARNQQSLFFAHWSKANFKQIKDIWDSENNCWKTGKTIHDQLQQRRNWIAEYSKLKKYIPNDWKNILLNVKVQLDTTLLENTRSVILSAENIIIDNEVIQVKKCKQRELYYACLYPTVKPTCIDSWSRAFQQDITIENIRIRKNPIYCKKSKNFHWKTLHRAIYTESKL